MYSLNCGSFQTLVFSFHSVSFSLLLSSKVKYTPALSEMATTPCHICDHMQVSLDIKK